MHTYIYIPPPPPPPPHDPPTHPNKNRTHRSRVSGNNLNHKASIIPSVFAKLNLQNWVIRQTIPNSYTEQSPEKNYWALKKAEGGIRIHVQTRRADAAVVLDLDQDINKRYYFKV
jgi:hypothetical protein